MERDEFLKDLLMKGNTESLPDDFTDKLMEKIMQEKELSSIQDSVFRKWWFWFVLGIVCIVIVSILVMMYNFNLLKNIELYSENLVNGVQSFYHSIEWYWRALQEYPVAFIVIFAMLLLLGADKLLKKIFHHKTSFIWLV